MLVANPDYLANTGRPGSIEDLAHHRLIDKMHGADLLGWSDIVAKPGGAAAIGRTVFRCDDFEAMRLAALSGLGIAFLPDWVVGADTHTGELLRLDLDGEHWNNDTTGVWLLRALAEPSASLRVVSAALRETIGSPPTWTAKKAT